MKEERKSDCDETPTDTEEKIADFYYNSAFIFFCVVMLILFLISLFKGFKG